KQLDLSKSKLESWGLYPLASRNLTQLKQLNLDGNTLPTIPALLPYRSSNSTIPPIETTALQRLRHLFTLEVEGNQLQDKDISPHLPDPLQLAPLEAGLKLAAGHPTWPATPMQELHLGTKLMEDVLKHSQSLPMLVFSINRLQEDWLAPEEWVRQDKKKLQTLEVSHNWLMHLPPFLLCSLRHLTLHHNYIKHISSYMFMHMELGLDFLQLSHNRLHADSIHNVSFLGLHASLVELLLDQNQVQAIPHSLLGLKGLQVLSLSHDEISHPCPPCHQLDSQDSNLISTHLENNFI
uniref:Uncharacterized protein n=1 Tax=Otolemur garnettii TaxID=30611 RepID=H0XSV8_OTOGA